MRTRLWLIAASAGLALAWCDPASAFRPFDGTDAAVAESDHLEIELGPAEYLRFGDERTLIAPNLRLNYGFAEGWEAVLEGRTTHGLSASTHIISQIDNAVSLKKVLRDGVLQDRSGPSIATEFGVLLPGVNDDHGVGGSIAGIVSQRWEKLTLHLNAAVSVTRQQHADAFLSAIVEGPHDWTVRPVAEIAYEREFGRAETKSVLIGAIWQASEDVAFDVGLRGGQIDRHALAEIRGGLTFSFIVGRAGKAE